MAIFVTPTQGKDFEPLSEGIHTLILADVVDLGMEQTPWGNKPKVRFVYLADEADEEGFTKRVFEKFTASLHEKSSLRARVEEILGRPLNEQELKTGLDDNTIIGCQKKAVIEHNEGKAGKVFANVKAIIKGKASGLSIPTDFVRAKDKNKQPGANTQSAAAKSGGGTAVAKAILAPAGAPITDEDTPF
jgi:hypothetical protein